MNNQIDKRKMKWQTNFETFIKYFPTLIIDGNIDDLQPYIPPNGGGDHVEYVSIDEYFYHVMCLDLEEAHKKCVIIYDPTEADGKRFDIRAPFTLKPKPADPNQEVKENVMERNYSNIWAQHFWDIINDDGMDDHLIQHQMGGATHDMALIHYAVTENGRIPVEMGEDGNTCQVCDGELSHKLPDKIKRFIERTNSDLPSGGYVFILKMASRMLSRSSDSLDSDELLLFRQLLSISQKMGQNREHKLIILANKITDLPLWFTDEFVNPHVKRLTIDKPSEVNIDSFFDYLVEKGHFGQEFNRIYRESIALAPGEKNPVGETETPNEKKIKRKFRALVNDFSMKMLKAYEEYLKDGNKVDSPEQLGYSVASFRSGVVDNPWKQEDKVRNILNITEIVKERIKGQDQALDQIRRILERSAIGLGRVDNPNAPRVVLFLAGPTGTGKTEVCKQLAEAIFGSEDRMVRFDMSEYRQEHADQKLFGAPPGYVGYSEGGKLTNAIKKEPFSLVLFDEIEKAHKSILDKFLQILSDGRLTDGQGETVSFMDSIIAFTSNAGVYSPTPKNVHEAELIRKAMGDEDPPAREINMKAVINMENENMPADEIYNQVKNFFRYNVKHFFCGELEPALGRPELYGRIENALVYYNYIGKDAVRPICKAKMKSLLSAAKDEYGLVLNGDGYEPEILDRVVEYCQSEAIRAMGARGIGNAVNLLVEGSLSSFIKPYILGINGMSRRDLRGKTLLGHLKENASGLIQPEDIVWEA